MNLADLADEELAALVSDRHAHAPEAFEELLRRHQTALPRLFRRFHPRLEDASDLAQETWVRVWRSLNCETAGRFDPARGTFRIYLFGVARNVAIDWYRRSVRESSRQTRLAATPPEEESADDPPASDSLCEVIFSDLQEAILRKLDDRERVVFALLGHPVSMNRICELTGLSQPSVWRIQQKLKKAIDEVIAS